MKQKNVGLEAKRQRYGYIFVAHWLLGMALFFILPLLSSIWYAFGRVTMDDSGIVTEFVGFLNFKKLLFDNASYLDNVRDALISNLYSLPIILSLSLILGVLLNQKFIGQSIFRALFFLPIILASSVVILVMQDYRVNAPLFFEQGGNGFMDIETILAAMNVPEQLSAPLSGLLGNVLNLTWSCSVQTVLFLAGLQNIPESYYEVSKIEGANKWEEFWYIVIPSLRNIITLVSIYTMIDLCVSVRNPVMSTALSHMNKGQALDESSAMLWFYFSIVVVVIAAVLAAYKRFCLKRWE